MKFSSDPPEGFYSDDNLNLKIERMKQDLLRNQDLKILTCWALKIK